MQLLLAPEDRNSKVIFEREYPIHGKSVKIIHDKFDGHLFVVDDKTWFFHKSEPIADIFGRMMDIIIEEFGSVDTR